MKQRKGRLQQQLQQQPKKKTGKQPKEQPQEEQRNVNAIDAIFGKAKKNKKIEKSSAEHRAEKQQKKMKRQLEAQWKRQTKDRRIGEDSGFLRVENGMKIYNEEQLNIGKGGDTDKCPIDCNCCF